MTRNKQHVECDNERVSRIVLYSAVMYIAPIGITTNAEYRFILTLTRCIRVRGNVERMMCERERISGACIRRADSFAF